MKLKPYLEYKDSGIQWIGKIPEGWAVSRLKHILNLKSGDSTKNLKDGEYNIYGANGIIGKCDKYKFYKKNILIGRVGASGSILEARGKYWVSDNALLVILNKNNDYKFIKYKLISLNISDLANKNVQPLITATQIKSVITQIPKDLKEQTAIANFLDKRTAKIDTLIEKDKKLIMLLKEKRTALINHAVTKGLDPNVKMKDSDIPWIGEIPEGWEARKLKYIGKSIIGLTYSPEEILDNEGTLVLRASNIKNNKIDLTDKVYVNKNIPKKMLTKVGDILICSRSGSKALIGKNVCIYKNNTGHSFGVFTTVFRSRYWKFISYVFNSVIFYSQLNSCLTTTINQLTIESLNNILALFPDINTQNQIINFLNKETEMINKTIEKIEKKIVLLEEYKKSLIHHVVTGKIDVGEAVA